jgi:hypothetical protein
MCLDGKSRPGAKRVCLEGKSQYARQIKVEELIGA